jgi:hypothetical protein
MLALVKAWWAAKEGLESAAEAKRNDIDWSKKNFPFFAPLMHVESDELKNNKEKGILTVIPNDFFNKRLANLPCWSQ